MPWKIIQFKQHCSTILRHLAQKRHGFNIHEHFFNVYLTVLAPKVYKEKNICICTNNMPHIGLMYLY